MYGIGISKLGHKEVEYGINLINSMLSELEHVRAGLDDGDVAVQSEANCMLRNLEDLRFFFEIRRR